MNISNDNSLIALEILLTLLNALPFYNLGQSSQSLMTKSLPGHGGFILSSYSAQDRKILLKIELTLPVQSFVRCSFEVQVKMGSNCNGT